MILRPNFIYLAIFLIFQIWLSGQWHMFLWCDKLITQIYCCFTWILSSSGSSYTWAKILPRDSHWTSMWSNNTLCSAPISSHSDASQSLWCAQAWELLRRCKHKFCHFSPPCSRYSDTTWKISSPVVLSGNFLAKQSFFWTCLQSAHLP